MKKLILLLIIILTFSSCEFQNKKKQSESNSSNISISSALDDDLNGARILDEENDLNTEELVNYVMSKQNQFVPKGHYFNSNSNLSLLICVNKDVDKRDELEIYVFDSKQNYLRKHKTTYKEFLFKTKE